MLIKGSSCFMGLLVAAGLAQPVAAQVAFDSAAVVEDTMLETVTGREDINQLAQSQHVATVKDSSVSGNSVTGAVAIDGNAFQNLSGLSVINANTGNNVAINASMNVNIALSPAQ